MADNLIINPRTFAIIALASIGSDVSCFITPIPEQLLIEAKSRAINLVIQYGAIVIGQAVVGSKFVDTSAPAKLFLQGVESLTTAFSLEEAASRYTIAAAVLIISSLCSEDLNASLTFGRFLVVLVQNVLLTGSQVIFSKGLLKIFVIKNILIRVITEIQIERRQIKLGLPRAKFKFNIFRNKEKKDFVSKDIKFKKRKIRILSREISLPVLYQKELIIKQPLMVKTITI